MLLFYSCGVSKWGKTKSDHLKSNVSYNCEDSKIIIHYNNKTKLVIIFIVVGGGVYSVKLKPMHNKYCIHQ
jgi:membrane-bound inhibitor of C-type lysozyme